MQEKTQVSRGGGVGIGSASIVLIFAVLCLTTFTLITYIVAGNNKALVDAETRLVTGYYEADALAERIMFEIITTGEIPDTFDNVDITVAYDEDIPGQTVSFHCPITEMKALYVNVLILGDSYDILSWRMVDTGEWITDDGINVWTG